MVSSSRLSIAGSKLVSELQSRGFVIFDDVEVAGDAADWAGEIAENIDWGDAGESVEFDPVVAPDLETAKVNEVCFRATFSVCRRASRSRRFSFSCCVCSFLASRSETLSSSWEKDEE